MFPISKVLCYTGSNRYLRKLNFAYLCENRWILTDLSPFPLVLPIAVLESFSLMLLDENLSIICHSVAVWTLPKEDCGIAWLFLRSILLLKSNWFSVALSLQVEMLMVRVMSYVKGDQRFRFKFISWRCVCFF